MRFANRNQTKITKRNFTFDETKRNKISLFILFCFVSCFAKQKKGCEMETLTSTVQT
jgi:hypothetical protein